jgi:isopentenyl diphosphate isomerase/L-lactate dehydrogenase-like FMN-dependent dehydrogenase
MNSRRVAKRISNVRDAERRAKRRMPKSVYRAFAGTTGERLTVKDNLRAFAEVGFRPHVAVRHEHREVATTVLHQPLAMPVVVSPVGGLRLAHRDAELGFARAAGAMQVPVGVSTMSSSGIEDIVAATSAPVWFQLYLVGGRSVAEISIERARSAGCTALVVTVDMLGAHSMRNQIPTKVTVRNALRYLPEFLARPRWFVDYARDGLRLDAVNVRTSPTARPFSFAEAIPIAPTWNDIPWIAEAWQGPLVIKGVMRPDDALRAVDVGADAIVVSNHGGFVLDGVPGSLRALPSIVQTVGTEVEILLDGGVRTGADVVKALALGARAVLCGRACVWGLAAGGTAGVQRILEILRDGIEQTLTGLGCASIHDLDPTVLDLPAAWPARTMAG